MLNVSCVKDERVRNRSSRPLKVWGRNVGTQEELGKASTFAGSVRLRTLAREINNRAALQPTDVVQELSIEDFKTLAPMLFQINKLPLHVRSDVADYLENKGTRGWSEMDRKTLVTAWHYAESGRVE